MNTGPVPQPETRTAPGLSRTSTLLSLPGSNASSSGRRDARLVNLTKVELHMAREAFELYDKDGNGSIDVYELKEALRAVGEPPSEKELLSMIHEVDQNGNLTIELPEFLNLVAKYKEPTIDREEDSDILDAFVAMGGRYDRSGEVSTYKLKEYFDSFELNINIDKLVAEIDKDQSGYVDFEEFSELLLKS